MVRNLVIFVHGLGANNQFWGNTITALKTDPQTNNIDIKFWGYQTQLMPIPVWQRFPGIGQKKQTFKQLGGYLWSEIRSMVRGKDYNNIKILGHSMGGLVVASAVVYGLSSKNTDDKQLSQLIKGIAFVATPLGGAKLADRTELIFKIFGDNLQVNELKKDSPSRRAIVVSFVNQALKIKCLPLQIFRASDDSVVAENELIPDIFSDIIDNNNICKIDVLTGGHGECIKNLGDTYKDNLKKLITWITDDINKSISENLPENILNLLRDIKTDCKNYLAKNENILNSISNESQFNRREIGKKLKSDLYDMVYRKCPQRWIPNLDNKLSNIDYNETIRIKLDNLKTNLNQLIDLFESQIQRIKRSETEFEIENIEENYIQRIINNDFTDSLLNDVKLLLIFQEYLNGLKLIIEKICQIVDKLISLE